MYGSFLQGALIGGIFFLEKGEKQEAYLIAL
jgi:hypothetical protein